MEVLNARTYDEKWYGLDTFEVRNDSLKMKNIVAIQNHYKSKL